LKTKKQVNEKNHRKLYRECNGDYGILANRLQVERDRLLLVDPKVSLSGGGSVYKFLLVDWLVGVDEFKFFILDVQLLCGVSTSAAYPIHLLNFPCITFDL